MGDLAFLVLVFLSMFAANVACVHYVRWLDRQPRTMPRIFDRMPRLGRRGE